MSDTKSEASLNSGAAEVFRKLLQEQVERIPRAELSLVLDVILKRYVQQYDIGTENTVHCPCCQQLCSLQSLKAETDG